VARLHATALLSSDQLPILEAFKP
jgi:hypothetical protein